MTARSLILSLAAAAALYPTSATAAPIVVEAVPSVKVSLADLDLGSQAGRETLSKRIAGAAKTVCGTPDARELKMVQASARCRKAALSSANLQVERLLGTELALSKGKVEVRGTH